MQDEREQLVELACGARVSIKSRFCHDGYYGDVLAHDDEESSQKVLRVDVTLGGDVVANAVAGYLNERRGGHLAVLNISVAHQWRRHGIASKIYNYIESVYGDVVLPYPGNEGGAIQFFWYDRLKSEPVLLASMRENIGVLPNSKDQSRPANDESARPNVATDSNCAHRPKRRPK